MRLGIAKATTIIYPYLRVEEDVSMLHIYIYDDSIMKPTQHCLERGREGEGKWEYNGGTNLFKVHFTHVWNHNEILLHY
jgi:hypothetical protein